MFESDERSVVDPSVDDLAELIDVEPGWFGPLRYTWHTDDDCTIAPLWALVGGEARVVEDASETEAREAWEHAAVWTQADLDEGERLFRIADAGRTRRLLAAYRAAVQDLRHRYGREQGRRDSAGVQLFFAQTGLQLGLHPRDVARRVDVADTLEASLPRTWDIYIAGSAPWRAMDLAVRAAEGLTDEAWPAYDAAVAELLGARVDRPEERAAIGSLPKKLRSIRERVQRATMTDRATRARQLRTTILEHGRDGQSSLIITGPTVEITAMDAVLHTAAVAAHGAPDEDRAIGHLRYEIAKDLIIEGAKRAADPGTDASVPNRKGIVPTVVVTVPVMTLLGATDEPGHLEGVGPVDPETARRLSADAPSFFRLLTDPITGARLDLDRTTYVPPADLRRWVKLRDEVCRFPGCQRPAHRCDIDHAREWHEGGVTAAANLVSLCRRHHNQKGTGITAESLQSDGAVATPTPWGRTLVDPPPEPFDPAPDDCPF